MTTHRETDLLIIGAGFSGLIMAMQARKSGIRDIVILEKAQDVGGTWRENTYPGVACDIPSHLYSMASHLNPDWSTSYAKGGEIQAYIQRVASDEGLYELCRFGQTFRSAIWEANLWHVTTQEGHVWTARVLVSAVGALHVPLIPDIPGRQSFAGPEFHSAQWDHDADLSGKSVAVIGTGASAVQFVPEIAKSAERVTIFQRTAPYVLPRPDGPIAPRTRKLYARIPLLPRLRRHLIYTVFEMRHAVFRGKPRAVNFAMKMWRKSLENAIRDPGMRAALTPDYRIGCKRILSSNDWYPTLARDNVDLVPDGVAAIDGRTIVTRSGQRFEADVLIWGTGFHVTDAAERLDVTGLEGLRLRQAWADGMSAHLGTAIAGFPNFFVLLGPNTGLGHNSVVLMIEAQVAHVTRMLTQMRDRNIAHVAPRPEAQAAFQQEVQDRLASSVWQAGGCSSWYQDASGRNTTLWPGTVGEYRKRMARAGLEQYQITKQSQPEAS